MLRRVDLEPGLVEWVEREAGATVVGATRTYGGGSRVTWFVDGSRDGAPFPMVLRVESGEGAFSGSVLSLAREATVYRALQDTGVRIARLYGVETGGRALLLERVPGTGTLRAVGAEQRAAVLGDFMDALADLHLVDVDALDLAGFDHPASPEQHALIDLDLWTGLTEGCGPLDPEIGYALAWLRAHPPRVVQRTVLVQGDTGPGNFVADGARVSALVDWEFAHVGDPMDDLAWVAFRAGREPDVDLTSLFERYEARTGLRADPVAIAYYAVMVQVRCAITTARTIARGGGAVGLAGYLVAHRRFLQGLTTALAAASGVAVPMAPELAAERTSESARFDRAVLDLSQGVIPELRDPAVKLRARGALTFVRHWAAVDQLGAARAAAEEAELDVLLGPRPAGRRHDPEGDALRAAAVAAGRTGDAAMLTYLARRATRAVQLWPDPR